MLDLWFDSSTLLTALSPSKGKLTILSSTLHFVPRLSVEGRLKQTLARLGRPKGASRRIEQGRGWQNSPQWISTKTAQ